MTRREDFTSSSERIPEVFRGNFDECFAHFIDALLARAPKASHGCIKAKQPLASFCDVSVSTVTAWMSGTQSPLGVKLMKLTCYLDAIGYRVIELERMSKERRNLYELVGFGVCSVADLSLVAGFRNPKNMLRVLGGTEKTSSDKSQRLWDLWKDRREDLERKKEETRSVFSGGILPGPGAARTVARAVGQQELIARIRESTHVTLVPAGRQRAVTSVMQGLLAMLDDEEFSEPSEETIDGLRPMRDVVLRLSARLSVLSSELLSTPGAGGD